jgi:hypothetical protein
MQVLIRSDIPAAEAFFRGHLRVSRPEILASFHAPGSAMPAGHAHIRRGEKYRKSSGEFTRFSKSFAGRLSLTNS